MVERCWKWKPRCFEGFWELNQLSLDFDDPSPPTQPLHSGPQDPPRTLPGTQPAGLNKDEMIKQIYLTKSNQYDVYPQLSNEIYG